MFFYFFLDKRKMPAKEDGVRLHTSPRYVPFFGFLFRLNGIDDIAFKEKQNAFWSVGALKRDN